MGVKSAMQVIEVLIAGLIFMAIFPSVMTMFLVPSGNTTPYPAMYLTIFSIVPLLLVIGLLYMVWGRKGGKGGIKI